VGVNDSCKMNERTTVLRTAIIASTMALTATACASGTLGSFKPGVVDGEYLRNPRSTALTAQRPNFNSRPRYVSNQPDKTLTPNSKYYEYIINDYGSYATIFDYPKSTKQIGSINDVGGQGCTNVLYGYGKKTFWIMAGDTQMTEYQVPHKPLKTLSYTGGQPSSCAIDSHGDLAVGILTGFPNGAGDIVLFKHASGSGTVIPTQLSEEYFDGYDPRGNLFADGIIDGSRYNVFGLIELPNGSTTTEVISTSNVVEFPGSVQWDGKYLTVLDQQVAKIYRYSIKGTKATLKSTVTLEDAGDCAQTWIAAGVVYCADAGNDDGSVYKYPEGGAPLATFSGNFDTPLGTVAVQK
jgi:hypothetical protein